MSDANRMTYYVSLQGNDRWSGRLAEPDADGTDGPFASIEKARDVVRRLKQHGRLTGPVTVYLRGGRYPLAQPVAFGPEDSGPITYAAYPGERPVLDGGRRIEGWRVEASGAATRWVTDVPEATAGAWYFRQLFVNGQRRPRARLPKSGFYRIEAVPGTTFSSRLFEGTNTFQAAAGDIQPWRNLTDVEAVAVHYWIEERMPLASFDPQTRLVTSSRRSMFALKDDVAARYARYYVENVFEALSEPGEWYLDRSTGRLTYLPLPGEDPATTEVYAPRAEQFLTLKGEPEQGKYVEHLRFEGLAFEHSEWRQPPGGGERWGRFGTDFAASAQAASHIPGAIALEGARYCAIEDCTLHHIGWYGIEIGAGCWGNRIVGNDLFDLGAGGIKVAGSDADGPLARRTGYNRITDNHIHTGGRIFHSAVGILALDTFGNVLSHNHIHDLYYSGISSGWVWGYVDNVSMQNRIEQNHIHDLGHGLLSDMGGVYILGMQPGTVVRGNRIHDVEKANYGGWAIYLDEGSSHVLVENNVCYNTTSQAFHQHYGRENIVRNNVFAFAREGQASLTRVEMHNSFTFERNIVISRGQPIFVGGRAGHLQKRGFLSDLNLLWDVTGAAPVSGNGQQDEQARWSLRESFTLGEMQAMGYDTHSIVADPKCRDLAAFDFTLAADSPALALGFRPIDLSRVGPRPQGEREDDPLSPLYYS